MTAVAEDRTHPVEGALADLRRLLGQALATPVRALEDAALVEQVVQAGAVVRRAQALLLRLIGEADAREALLRDGAPSAQAWVRHRLRISAGEASSYVLTGRALRADLDETAEACAAGRIGLGHATTIVRTVADLPADRRLRPAAEHDLVAHAGSFDPTVLARLGRRMLAVADPDAEDARDGGALARAEERAARRMELSFTPDGEGGAWLRGRLDPEGSAVVRAGAKPTTSTHGRPAAAPLSTTACCSAVTTTGWSSGVTGRSPSAPTASPSFDHHPGPTPAGTLSATTCTTRATAITHPDQRAATAATPASR